MRRQPKTVSPLAAARRDWSTALRPVVRRWVKEQCEAAAPHRFLEKVDIKRIAREAGFKAHDIAYDLAYDIASGNTTPPRKAKKEGV